VLLTATLMSAGCAEEPPPPPDPELVTIYCELALAGGASGPVAPDSVRAAIFRRHGTTQETFESALQRYRDDARGWLGFYRAVVDTLDAIVIRQYPTAPVRRRQAP
jgi:hypothetical protein